MRARTFLRHHVDLRAASVRAERRTCRDLEEALGGIARALRLLEECEVTDPCAPGAPLVCNLGALSGTPVMTGLRTFFSGFSPLKVSRGGVSAPMWSAGSDRFGVHLRALGVEEILLTGRAGAPTVLVVERGPAFRFESGADLLGLTVNGKIQALARRFPGAHFAVIGPAGEHWQAVRYAAIALSTENQIRSGDCKPRFCGRGGFGGVMGSKNLLAIVATEPDRLPAAAPALKALNLEVARGDGSRRYRDADKGNGAGGTWFLYEALGPVHALPECNFTTTGTVASGALARPAVEAHTEVRDESCFRCGIACHKNAYGPDGFSAKIDYEPLNLLGSNLGIFEFDAVAALIALVDEMGLDSISCGATLSYAMEYNRRHPGAPVAEGLSFGDARGAARAIRAVAEGRLPQLGQGVRRLAEETREGGYAMECKGVELPAYLPHTNPGYPFALAGGHMSMRTYLLLMFERETGLDYWVDAITRRGPMILRDDLLGVCKFGGMKDEAMSEALREAAGIEATADELRRAVLRTHLRGYRLERRLGFTEEDYDPPAAAHERLPPLELPHFLTRGFHVELKRRVLARFDEMLAEEGL